MTAQTKPSKTAAELFGQIQRAKRGVEGIRGRVDSDTLEYRKKRERDLLLEMHIGELHGLQRELDELQAHCGHEKPSVLVRGKHRCPDCYKEEQRHD